MAMLSRAHIVLIALVLAGCAAMRAPLEPPIVHLTDLRLRDVQLFEQRYVLGLRVENPNPHELPIWGMTYKVSLNNVELGRGVSRERLTIPPYGETVVNLDLSSNVFSLIERVRDLAAGDADSVKFSISGNVSVANMAEPLPFSLGGQLGGAAP